MSERAISCFFWDERRRPCCREPDGRPPHRTFAVPLSHTRDVCPHFSLPRCGIDDSLSRSIANERRSRGLAKPRPCRERASEERERRSDDVEKDMPVSPSSSLLASALLSPRRSPRRFYLAQRRHRRCKLLPAHAQRDDRGGGQGLVRRVHFVSFFSSRKRKTDRAPLSLSSPSSLVPSSRLSGFAARLRSEREKEREIEREKKETKSGERNEERSLYLLCSRRRRPRARRKKCRLGSKTQKKTTRRAQLESLGIEESPTPLPSPMAAAPEAAAAVVGQSDHMPYTLERDYKFDVQGDMTALLLFR